LGDEREVAMTEAGYQLRLAVPSDVARIKRDIRVTLVNPEGKPQRKRYDDAVARQEVLVLAHSDAKEGGDEIAGFLEWHAKVDGGITIRDMGTTGEAPHVGTLRRLLRELLHMYEPPNASVKVRSDLQAWNDVFLQTPGFASIGREYSRPYWRAIYEWTRENERLAERPAAIRRRRP
jgi:hypothetical protein